VRVRRLEACATKGGGRDPALPAFQALWVGHRAQERLLKRNRFS
jgi:hypothetical protein